VPCHRRHETAWREFEFMITTPGAPVAPGGRPTDLPPTLQCLFPSDIKAGSAVVPVDSVGGIIDDGFSNRLSRYWGPHTTSRKCVSAFLRRSCTVYTLSRAHVLPDGSPRTNLKKRFSSSSRKAQLQQRQHLRHPRQPTVHPVT
jgi:hypothetical protein